MLHSVEQVKAAMALSTEELRRITESSGYRSEGYKSAECWGMNESGRFVYFVEYIDSTNGNGMCEVYITIKAGGGYELEF